MLEYQITFIRKPGGITLYVTLKLLEYFPEWLHCFTFPPAVYDGCSFSTPCQHLLLSGFFVTVILMGMKWHLIVVLVFISLMTDYVEHFSCAFWPFIYLL